MRKMVVSNMVSLDGFFEGPNKELDFHIVDEEFQEYSIDMLNNTDALLFGRVTYDLMLSYWTMPDAIVNDTIVAGFMNSLPKIVFSNTLDKVEWNNSRLMKENIIEGMKELKKQPGKDLMILGSGSIVSFFTQQNLIDEYRLVVSPVLLGNGNPLFKEINKRINLKLVKSRIHKSGTVILNYELRK